MGLTEVHRGLYRGRERVLGLCPAAEEPVWAAWEYRGADSAPGPPGLNSEREGCGWIGISSVGALRPAAWARVDMDVDVDMDLDVGVGVGVVAVVVSPQYQLRFSRPSPRQASLGNREGGGICVVGNPLLNPESNLVLDRGRGLGLGGLMPGFCFGLDPGVFVDLGGVRGPRVVCWT